jgi:diamine N-acetyltransferase
MTESNSTDAISIKKCIAKDIPAITGVALQSYLFHYTYLWNDHGVAYMRNSFSSDQVAKELADNNAAFFLIYDAAEAIGFMKLNIDQPLQPFEADHCLELERIYILKKSAGKGIGKYALQFTEDYARLLGKTILWLKTMDNSDALKFYQKQQFEFLEAGFLTFPQLKTECRKILTLYKRL